MEQQNRQPLDTSALASTTRSSSLDLYTGKPLDYRQQRRRSRIGNLQTAMDGVGHGRTVSNMRPRDPQTQA
jgi:hypothetical protein